MCEGSPDPDGKCLFCPLDDNILARTSHLLLSLSSPLMVHLEAHSYRSKAGFHLSGWPTCSQSMEPIVPCIDLRTSFSVNCIIWWAQRSRVTFTQESILGSKQLLHHHLMLPRGAFGSISAWHSARLLLLLHQTSHVFRRFLTETLSFPHGGDLLLTSYSDNQLFVLPRKTHGPSAWTCMRSWCHQTRKRGKSPLDWSSWGSFIGIIERHEQMETFPNVSWLRWDSGKLMRSFPLLLCRLCWSRTFL